MTKPNMSRNPDRNDQSQTGFPSPIDVQRYLKGMDYPASKQDLLDCAMEQGAAEDVLEALEELPEKTYNGPTDVMSEFGEISDEEQRSAS